ncbi:hypothetical protein GH733_002702 [Mirounga leonina]|nr:hypothetical protein GH733_002702 [Mirounga leonina]
MAARVWRQLLWKRWLLALVFQLLLVYFLLGTSEQEERATTASPFCGKCCNTLRPFKGSTSSPTGWDTLVKGRICWGTATGTSVNVPGTKQYRCDGCLPHDRCSACKCCVSCCRQPSKRLLLARLLTWAAVVFRNLFMAVKDHFELRLAKCRTSSQVPRSRGDGRVRAAAEETPALAVAEEKPKEGVKTENNDHINLKGCHDDAVARPGDSDQSSQRRRKHLARGERAEVSPCGRGRVPGTVSTHRSWSTYRTSLAAVFVATASAAVVLLQPHKHKCRQEHLVRKQANESHRLSPKSKPAIRKNEQK